jgi:FkbM family methyltransferase
MILLRLLDKEFPFRFTMRQDSHSGGSGSFFEVCWGEGLSSFGFKFSAPGYADHIHDNFLAKGIFYEEDLLRFLASLRLDNGVVVDVGAYVGNHSIFFAGVMGMTVVSIEPNVGPFRLLRSNIEANGLCSQIIPLCVAASDGSGERYQLDGFLEGNLGSMRLTPFEEFEGSQEGFIDSIALDHLKLDQVALIKIDVEGLELAVLSGLVDTIERDKPVLAIECSSVLEFARTSAWCHKKGYVPVARKAWTHVLVYVHETRCADVCHGCPPPPWSSLVP